MKPSKKPLVCVVVLDKQNRRSASSAYQRRFFTRVREAAQACKEKVPRARLPTCAGYRQNFQSNDDEILAGKPLVIRWFVYIFAALCLCGIVPMAAAEWLIWFCDSFGCWWLPLVLLVAEVWFILHLIGRDVR